MFTALASRIERNYLALALGMSAMALIYPPAFTWIKPYITFGLGVIMFGMGMTLDFKDFQDIKDKWRIVGLGAALQYTVMPLLALTFATVFGLPLEVAVGLVLVGACPGGTASNVVTYIARGNVALSVTMTLFSTVLAPLLTPAIVYALYQTKIEIAFFSMMKSVFWIVVFPLFDGLVLRHFLRKRMESSLVIFPSISIVTIAAVIACVVGLNQKTILDFPFLIILAVTMHNLSGFGLGYLAARLTNCTERDARTVAIEVGMQNSGLGVALANIYFSAAAALPGAIFSLEQNLAGIVLAKWWAKRQR